jgi:prepilin-type N-terminal cleavage/methylation domain-containing protein
MTKLLAQFFTKALQIADREGGFTMIELLVVISVIGVLAVAVLSSINPIEQINKGRDTRTRSDAAQLINAVDRYFAIQEYYPWNKTTSTYTASDTDYESQFVFTGSADDWDWTDELVTTAEVKEGFVNRLKNDDNLVVFKEGTSNATMYSCFLPTSQAFKREAADNCQDGTTPDGIGSITTCATTDGTIDDNNYICLP